MRAPRIIVRAALVCGATGIALGVWAASDDHAAQAADKRPAAEQPGGLLGATVRLPEQAAGRAKQVVAKVTARVPAPVDEPTEDQAETPEPAPPADPPADLPPVELPPVLDPPPVVVEPTPVELPPIELPLPLPPIEVPPLPAPPLELPPAPLPTTPVDLPDTPVSLPGLATAVDPMPVAPGPAAMLPAETVVTQLIAELSAGTNQPADCADSPDDARHIDRNALRHLLAGLDREPPAAVAKKPAAPGCPGTPDRGTPGGVQVKPPPPSAAEMVVADLDRSHVPPALGRLEHARARSSIPASRTTHPEPGPA